QARAGIVDDDAIAARERELQPAAETESAYQRECRIRCSGELVEGVPTALDDRQRIVHRPDPLEFLDVGAGDEAAVLARADDQSFGRRARELAQNGTKLVEYVHRECISRRAGLVEDQPRDAIGVAIDRPMPEIELRRHVGHGRTPTLAASLANSAAALPPNAGAPAQWYGSATVMRFPPASRRPGRRRC